MHELKSVTSCRRCQKQAPISCHQPWCNSLRDKPIGWPHDSSEAGEVVFRLMMSATLPPKHWPDVSCPPLTFTSVSDPKDLKSDLRWAPDIIFQCGSWCCATKLNSTKAKRNRRGWHDYLKQITPQLKTTPTHLKLQFWFALWVFFTYFDMHRKKSLPEESKPKVSLHHTELWYEVKFTRWSISAEETHLRFCLLRVVFWPKK